MNLMQKASYIKGLIDGLKLDKKNDQNKIILAMADLLEEITENIDELNMNTDEIFDEIDTLDEEISKIESCDCDFNANENIYETKCPACGNVFMLDEEQLEEDIICPECGKVLEIDLGCSCGCGCDCDCKIKEDSDKIEKEDNN